MDRKPVKEQLIRFSEVFRRSFFEKLVAVSVSKDEKVSRIREKCSYGTREHDVRTMLNHAYKSLQKTYCNEYVLKNSLLLFLLKEYKNDKTIRICSEFRIADKYADVAVFNGKSIVYEIKTELDDSRRLNEQIRNYRNFFQEIYILTTEKLADKYAKNYADVGVVYFDPNFRSLVPYRESECFAELDVSTLMRILHTSEYKNLVKELCNGLPQVGAFGMYDECLRLLQNVERSVLRARSLDIIKHRSSNLDIVKDCMRKAAFFAQMCLSRKVNTSEYRALEEVLEC